MSDLTTSRTYTGFTPTTVKYFVFMCIYKVDELKSSPNGKKQANFGKRLATNFDNKLTSH